MSDKYAVICKADNIDTRTTEGNLKFEGAKVQYRKHARNCTDIGNLWIWQKKEGDQWVIVKNELDRSIDAHFAGQGGKVSLDVGKVSVNGGQPS